MALLNYIYKWYLYLPLVVFAILLSKYAPLMQNNDIGSNLLNQNISRKSPNDVYIAVASDAPPYSYSKGESIIGFNVSIVNTIVKSLNLNPILITYKSYDDLLIAFNDGLVDIIGFPINGDSKIISDYIEKDKLFISSAVYHKSKNVILYNKLSLSDKGVLPGLDSEVKNLTILQGCIPGIVRYFGDFDTSFSADFFKDLDYIYFDNFTQLSDAMIAKKIDYAIVDKSLALHLSYLNTFLSVAEIDLGEKNNNSEFVFAFSSKQLSKVFDKELDALKKRDMINIFKKNFDVSS